MDYPKSVPNVGLVDGQFADENPATGQVGSLIPSAWGNAVTQELLNVIKAAGFAPAEGQTNQLLKAIQGLVSQGIKNSVRVATTGAIALSGVQTIDAIVLVAGDRVLVKNQASGAQNGIYVAAAGAWTRALDADESVEVKPGMLVGVDAGTVNGGSVWRLSNATPPTLGATALTFEQVFGKTGVVAGSYKSVTVGADGRVTGGTNPTTLGGYDITDAYTKTQADSLLSGKANKATTLAGYGITDALRAGDYGSPTASTARHFRITANVEDGATSWNALVNEGVHWNLVKGSNPDGPGGAEHYYCKTYVRLPWNSSTGTGALQQFAEPYATPTGVSEYWYRGLNGSTWSPWIKIQTSADHATQAQAEVNSEAAASSSVWMSPLRVLQAISNRVVQATEAVVGIAKIATQALTNAGADDTSIVTPKKLRFGFNINLGTNGYIVLPSWMLGLIFQWGRVATPTADVDYAVTFPLAFPAAVRSIQVSYGYSGSRVNDGIVAQVGDYTLQGFQANRQDIGATTSVPSAYISYFAVGY